MIYPRTWCGWKVSKAERGKGACLGENVEGGAAGGGGGGAKGTGREGGWGG